MTVHVADRFKVANAFWVGLSKIGLTPAAVLRQARVPVSLREYLMLMEGMKAGIAAYSIEDFYYLSRSALVKRAIAYCFASITCVSPTYPKSIPSLIATNCIGIFWA